MKLVCDMNDRLTPIYTVDKQTWEAFLKPPNLLAGIPSYAFVDEQGGVHLWPKPIPECKIYRLEEQGFVKE